MVSDTAWPSLDPPDDSQESDFNKRRSKWLSPKKHTEHTAALRRSEKSMEGKELPGYQYSNWSFSVNPFRLLTVAIDQRVYPKILDKRVLPT